LWSREFFPEMMGLTGDAGARRLLENHLEVVAEVEMDSDGVLTDIDTPDALAALRERTRSNAA
jgi:molybdenum cofactor cytidylyltransferase